MKRFLQWTVSIAALGVAGVFAARAIQSGREKLKRALGQAEAVTDRTRAALQETEAALHKTREAI